MKVSAKRRRSKAQIKLDKEQEELTKADMDELWAEICDGKAAGGIDFAGFCK